MENLTLSPVKNPVVAIPENGETVVAASAVMPPPTGEGPVKQAFQALGNKSEWATQRITKIQAGEVPHASLELSAAGADAAVTPIPGLKIITLPANMIESTFTWSADTVANPLETRKVIIDYTGVRVEANTDGVQMRFYGLDFTDATNSGMGPDLLVKRCFPRARGFVRLNNGSVSVLAGSGFTAAAITNTAGITVTLTGGAMKDATYQVDCRVQQGRSDQDQVTGSQVAKTFYINEQTTTAFNVIISGGDHTLINEFHFTVWNHP